MGSKLFAVRKPEVAKGVYTTKKEIAKVRKEYHAAGLSVKEFKPEEVEAARAWAGVKGTVGTPMKTIKEQTKQSNPSGAINLKTIEKLLTQLTSVNKGADLKQVIQAYAKKGYRHLKLTLITGENLFITLQDCVYLTNTHQTTEIIQEVDLTDYRKDKSYSYSSTYDYHEVILASLKTATTEDLSVVKDAFDQNLIGLLKQTEIEYGSTFITFSQFNHDQEKICTSSKEVCPGRPNHSDFHKNYCDSNGKKPTYPPTCVKREIFQHADQIKTISADAIVSITPYSLGLENRYLDLPGLSKLIKQVQQEKNSK